MRNSKLLASGTALVLAAALGVAGVGSSAAYFSDTVTGGMIVVSSGPPEHLLIAVDTHCIPAGSGAGVTCDIRPGDPRGETEAPEICFEDPYNSHGDPLTLSQQITVTNTGEGVQDVFIQFGPGLDDFNAELEEGAVLQISVDGRVKATYGTNPLGQYTSLTEEPVLLADDLPAGESIEVKITFTPDPGRDNVGGKTVQLPYQVYATASTDETPVDINEGLISANMH